MGNIFDILPPQPKTKKQEEKPRTKKSRGSAWFLVFVIFMLLVIFWINSYPANINQNSTTKPTPQVDSVDFNLFDNNLNFNEQASQIKIRLINASGNINETKTMKNILAKAGFQIEQTTVTDTTYDQTIIYYKKEDLNKANQVEDALTTSYNVKKEESTTLGNSYDILLVIGQNKIPE